MNMKQTFKRIKIKLTEYDPELSKAGWKVGEILDGSQEIINGTAKTAVWFSGKGSIASCVAYLGHNCKLISAKT